MATSGHNPQTGQDLPQLRDLNEALPTAKDTLPFTQPWDFGDVTFIIEGRKLYVNKAVLSVSSDVFSAMFTSGFKEKTMTEIPLPDKKFDDFLQLMQILHPVHNASVNDTNLASVLPLAHEYQVQYVIEQCENVLVKQPPSIHNLILANKFSLSELRKVCIQYMKDTPYSKLEEDPEFEIVGKDILLEVFQYKLCEGKDPSKGVIFQLMSQPSSIKNLLLAEKHDVPESYEKCLQYLKDTPLAQLKEEAGFTNLKPDTLFEVLKYKVEKLEPIVTEVSNIASWVMSEQQDWCSDRYGHYKGADRDCPSCKQYYCTSGDHLRGTDRDCLECNKYRFDEISEAVKRC